MYQFLQPQKHTKNNINKQSREDGYAFTIAYLQFIENELEVGIEIGKGGIFIANENNMKDNKGKTLRLLTARFRDAKY